MPKVCYIPRDFKADSLEIIDKANQIIAEYRQAGLRLTLRQLYYQFVARDLIANKQSEYKRLGSIVNDARLAGLIDWHAIEDRTRNIRSNAHWDDPADIIEAASRSFALDKWEGQRRRVEVWIEKDALVGVIEEVCQDLDVSWFSCRGYVSQSEMWDAAQRLIGHSKQGQHPLILHLGDHDPSGIDMSRDILDRICLFMESHGHEAAEIKRIALTEAQVDQYSPPPNPAKVTDSRAPKYIARYGRESWELDALEPTVLVNLIRREVRRVMDADAWNARYEEQEEQRKQLTEASRRWTDVVSYLENDDDDE